MSRVECEHHLRRVPEGGRLQVDQQVSPSDFDLAFVVDATVQAGAMVRAIRQAGGAILEHVRIFDVFHLGDLPEGSRSVALRIRLRALDRTLTDDDVAATRDKCIQAMAKVGGQIRQ